MIRRLERTLGWVFAITICCLSAACSRSHPLYLNVFRDDYANRESIETPSSELARSLEAGEAVALVRPHHELPVAVMDGTVYHTPLFFEDEHEAPTDQDGTKVDGKDFVLLAYSPARFMVNLVVFPVRAFFTPPWELTGSDGVADTKYILVRHDPKPVHWCEACQGLGPSTQ